MSNLQHSKFEIPKVEFKALPRISYDEFSTLVLARNKYKITRNTMNEMFLGIIYNVFYFRPKAEQETAESQVC